MGTEGGREGMGNHVEWDAQSRFEELWLDSFGVWGVGVGGLLRIRLEGLWAPVMEDLY